MLAIDYCLSWNDLRAVCALSPCDEGTKTRAACSQSFTAASFCNNVNDDFGDDDCANASKGPFLKCQKIRNEKFKLDFAETSFNITVDTVDPCFAQARIISTWDSWQLKLGSAQFIPKLCRNKIHFEVKVMHKMPGCCFRGSVSKDPISVVIFTRFQLKFTRSQDQKLGAYGINV